MKNKVPILFTLILLISCKNQTQEKTELVFRKESNSKINRVKDKAIKSDSESSYCEKYWIRRFPDDSIKSKIIDEIISQNHLSENNMTFLKALKTRKQGKLAFENILSPIFRLSNTEIGLFAFPTYEHVGNKLIPTSREMDLITNLDTMPGNKPKHFGEIKFYPMLLESVFENRNKPSVYYYTTDQVGSTKILDLGAYADECLEYYEYSIDTTAISINDKVLFSSPFKIDLVFECNTSVDSLLKDDFRKECFDCPNSIEFQKTFARLKGTDNLFFIYSDTFPFNNELDTPSRALVFINAEKEIIYLWYEEIDFFGCSCL